MDEEFDALEAFFYALEDGILQLLENVEVFLHHLQVCPSPSAPLAAAAAAAPPPQTLLRLSILWFAQRFLACRTEEFDFDMDGEKEAICFKEISTALRQWILPEFVSVHQLRRGGEDAAQPAGTPVLPRRKRG